MKVDTRSNARRTSPLPQKGERLQEASTSLTVWFDGACPLCRREISLFKKLDRRGAIHFEDVDRADAVCPLDRAELLSRFHAQERGCPVVSGAAAFAAMWRAIPLLRPFGEIARFPPILWALDLAYRRFLIIRPRLQKLVH
jgi:predicted DCC family thiol-disulfide oxidoreductase YuxK